uniref:Eukaryotic translation initiation factor 1Aa n=1 Tax=Rhizophora mucronata TaxID=61149 RepID=A0A2P2INL6_RHIMU
MASQRPLPSMRSTCAYSCPSSLKMSSRFSSSASFFPLFLFFPPFPLFFGMLPDSFSLSFFVRAGKS